MAILTLRAQIEYGFRVNSYPGGIAVAPHARPRQAGPHSTHRIGGDELSAVRRSSAIRTEVTVRLHVRAGWRHSRRLGLPEWLSVRVRPRGFGGAKLAEENPVIKRGRQSEAASHGA